MRPILVIAYWFKSRKNSKRKEHKHQHKCKWHIPNKSQITRSSITALLPNISSKPNFSKSLWIWIVVFTEKSLLFFGKYTFNIHFFVLNIHFFFVQKSTYMKISIMKLFFLLQKQISKKRFQILCCFVNRFPPFSKK